MAPEPFTHALESLTEAVTNLANVDIAVLAEKIGKIEARAIVAEARLLDEQRKTAGTEQERRFFRKRTQLFENLIHDYHTALVFYASRGNWNIVLDPDRSQTTHAIPNGWERASEAIDKGLRHSEALGEHLQGSPEAIRNKLLARKH